MLIGLIGIALAFDFINGLHDAANSIATVVSTRVLVAAARGRLGRLLQLRRVPVLRPPRRRNDRERHHRSRRSSTAAVIFGALVGAILLERDHLVARHPVEQQPCPGRRAGRRRHRQGRPRRDRLVRRHQDQRFHLRSRRCSAWLMAIIIVVVTSWLFKPVPANRGQAFRRLQLLSSAALFDRPWRQRRAEDDGDHHCPPVQHRLFAWRIPRAVLGRPRCAGGDGARHADGRLADRPDDGLEDHPAHAAPGLLRGDRRTIMLFGATASEFRFRPPIRLPARSWASAPRGELPPCAGASPAISSSPGFSPFPRRQQIAALVYAWFATWIVDRQVSSLPK